MELFRDYLVENRDFTSYEDLKAHCKFKVPEDFNFAYDVVDRYAQTEPEKRAMVWVDDNGEERTFTFADISRESKRTAFFLHQQGIKKGDAVMLILRRRYEFWYFIIALHRIGAIVIPATDQLLTNDIVYRNNAAEVKMIVSYDNPQIQKEIEESLKQSKSVKKIVTVGKEKQGWINFHKEADELPAEFLRPFGEDGTTSKAPMLLYFTSGTSGYPKMVMHDFTYPIAHIITAKYWHGVVENGLHLTVAETGWGKAVWGKLYGQWFCGCAVFTYDMTSFRPDKMLQMISKYHVTSFCAPPTVYRYLIRQDLSQGKYDFSTLQRCTTAGEALNPEVYNQFLKQTGLKMYESYGQTETVIVAGNFLDSDVKPGSMGKPSPLYDVHILDANGKECPAGEVGELTIDISKDKPIGLFAGYYRDITLTANAFDSGVYHTGDTAYMDEDGFIWFVGRKDDIIKSSGYRISPFEVESVLMKHKAVMECAVTGVEDEKRGQAVKATIVLSPGFEPSHELEVELLTFCKNETALYKCPRIIEFVKELPKTISGKIRRVEIREKDKGVEEKNIKQEF